MRLPNPQHASTKSQFYRITSPKGALKGMWYLRKVTGSCEQIGPVATCLFLKNIKYCFRNSGNGREDKNGDR